MTDKETIDVGHLIRQFERHLDYQISRNLMVKDGPTHTIMGNVLTVLKDVKFMQEAHDQHFKPPVCNSDVGPYSQFKLDERDINMLNQFNSVSGLIKRS